MTFTEICRRGYSNGYALLWILFTFQELFRKTVAQTSVKPGTKCYKNEDLGEYDDNIYYCTDAEKTECCEKDEEFTCCESSITKNLKEQVALWGAVFGIVGAIAFLWVCYRKDTYLCEGDSVGQRMKRCCGKAEVEDKDEDINAERPPPRLSPYVRSHDSPRRYSNALSASRIRPDVTADNGYDVVDTDSGRGSTSSLAFGSPNLSSQNKEVSYRRNSNDDIIDADLKDFGSENAREASKKGKKKVKSSRTDAL